MILLHGSSLCNIFTLCCIIATSSLEGTGLTQEVYSFFGGYPYHTSVDQEYEIPSVETLHIHNNLGSISITTEWKRSTLCIKATTHARYQEDLNTFTFSLLPPVTSSHKEATLKTHCSADAPQGTIDLAIIIPAHKTVEVTTQEGNITVNDTHAALILTSQEGSIVAQNIHNTLTAQTGKNGSITLTSIHAGAHTTTERGSISISQATESIIAQSDKGSLLISCSHIPHTARIIGATNHGSIDIAVPENTNALFRASTQRGTVTSTHYLTLHPQTTCLDKKAWDRFKREVDGTLGTGEAEIHLTTLTGSIKLTSNKEEKK